MPRIEPSSHPPFEAYSEALEAFHIAAGIVLFEFARDGCGNRDLIVRNCIARADVALRAVFRLWDLKDYQDCWVLNRCLLDRLFHLRHLQNTDSFDTFEKWSFLEQYKAINRVKSDPELEGVGRHPLYKLSDEQKKRATDLVRNPPEWHRPKAEAIAKEMDMRFLYVYGYDFASTHVHPMANDGEQDFYEITRLEPRPSYPDQRSVLANTFLVATMIVQEGLNSSSLRWRALVYDMFENLRRFLDRGSTEYRQSLMKMASAVRQGVVMCQKSDG
jgi:hypothetical protein